MRALPGIGAGRVWATNAADYRASPPGGIHHANSQTEEAQGLPQTRGNYLRRRERPFDEGAAVRRDFDHQRTGPTPARLHARLAGNRAASIPSLAGAGGKRAPATALSSA